MDFNNIIKQNFLYPVGSVDSTFDNMSDEFNEVANKVQGNRDFGHSGVFHKGNPYYIQLLSANNEQDKDALYELAVKWEGQQADYAQQLGVNYAIMQEQREYDSPSSVIARQRAAGINPDIASGSSSGTSSGSASLNTPQLSQIEGGTKFSNNYDRQLVSSQWLSSIIGLFGGISSIGSSVVGAIDTLNTLSGRVALGEAQGQLATNQADLIKQQTPALVSAAQSQSSSAFTDSAIKNLSLYDSMAQMFTSDSTDDEITSLLSTLGYGDDIIPRHLTNFRNFQKNPALQKLYTDNKVESAKSQSYADSYSIKMYGDTVALQQKVEYDSLRLDELRTSLEHSFNSYLDTAGFSQLSAQNLVESQELSSNDIEFSRQKLEQDMRAYTSYIYNLAQYSAHSRETVDKIYSKLTYVDPKTKQKVTRNLTPDEQRIIDSENLKQLMIGMLGSQHMQQLVNMYNHSSHLKYVSGKYITSNGDVNPLPTSEARIRFEDYTFNMFVDNASTGTATAESLFDSMVGMIPVVGGIMLKTSNNSTSKRR